MMTSSNLRFQWRNYWDVCDSNIFSSWIERRIKINFPMIQSHIWLMTSSVLESSGWQLTMTTKFFNLSDWARTKTSFDWINQFAVTSYKLYFARILVKMGEIRNGFNLLWFENGTFCWFNSHWIVTKSPWQQKIERTFVYVSLLTRASVWSFCIHAISRMRTIIESRGPTFVQVWKSHINWTSGFGSMVLGQWFWVSGFGSVVLGQWFWVND